MGKKRCMLLAFVNLILGGIGAFIYLPYFFEAFNMNVAGWSNAIHRLLSENYSKLLIWFGIILLAYIIITKIITMLSSKNLSCLCFKLSSIIALLLPLLYVMALQFDSILELWIKHIASNIKTISLIAAIISCGLLLLGIISSITRNRKLNIYLLIQSIAMCTLLVLLVSINSWVGWTINTIKGFGMLMAICPVYLLISVIILIFSPKKGEMV